MPIALGSRLGPYEIIAPLGAGGMGEVYRARDPRLKRDIAIKVLPADVTSSPDRLARLEREATTVAGLNHPNIVVLHSIEEDGGVRFLTMELVEGRSLSELVTPGGLPLAQVLDLGIPLADALVAAHEKGVVHRDLKPANVMVSREGRVKVLDFGLAKIAQTEPDVHATRVATIEPISDIGQVVGTIPYMAPEQIRGEAVDARSDLFSLGILLYELAGGRRPFTGESHADVSSAILRDNPPSLASLRGDLPGELAHIVERCLEKRPRERFQTAQDVLNELRSVRRTLERGAPAPRPASDKLTSIAVLPFVNRSANAEDEYFSDGLADELLNVLSKIKGLRVVARTSSFQFKGTKDDIATIGARLDVATVLEGSVRKAGQRVRISVQLVKVADSSHLWSESYDRTLDDIFAVQDDIARAVVKELRTTLLGQEADSQASGEVKAEVSNATKGRATDPEAHRLFLLARHLLDMPRADTTLKAIEYLRQALERDPDFALAWSELSRAHARAADMNLVPVAEGYAQARKAVERALELEPELAEAHARLAWIQLTYFWDWPAAEAAIGRALKQAPGNAIVLRVAGQVSNIVGRTEEATLFCARSLEQDPLSAIAHSTLAIRLYSANLFAEAEQEFRKTLELGSGMPGISAYLAICVLARGQAAEALVVAAQESEEVFRLWGLALVQDALGHPGDSEAALRQLIEKHAEDSAYQIAEVYGARHAAEEAFLWLDRAFTQRDGGLPLLRLSPQLRPLHGDPRWPAFLKKMGFDG
jgi:serine/threonine protein kinase/tetratricopeptide (TPR) repeat protein